MALLAFSMIEAHILFRPLASLPCPATTTPGFVENGYNLDMLARYKIYRGKPPAGMSLPEGIRQDARKHTRHCLRPDAAAVDAFLKHPTEPAWRTFSAAYRRTLQDRFGENRLPFDELADQARRHDVFIGCSCPTKKNPDVNRCHTVLALRFMKKHYPDLTVEFPAD